MASSSGSITAFMKPTAGGGESVSANGLPPEKENKGAVEPIEMNEVEMEEQPTTGKGGKPKAKKRLSIERIYQKKTQLEHILLRPDTYIGSVERTEPTAMWVYDSEQEKIVNREITYVPGLYKIFDEIIVNAADNKQRDPNMTMLKVDIDPAKNEISVWNNGQGIPVVIHKEHQVYVPEMIFGMLLTGSNYNDFEKKVVGGRNGYGAKLCNIFSKKFVIETSNKDQGHKAYKQVWYDNMGRKDSAKVADAKKDDYTKVTFQPDLSKFGMTELEPDTVALLMRRAFDVAGSLRGVKVLLNGKRLPVVGFKQYVEQVVKDSVDESGEPLKIAYEQCNDRWEVACTVSDGGFKQISFVNAIATTKGGRHTDYIADMVTSAVIDNIKKKLGKGGMNIKPFQIKNHMWLFVNCLIENPSFDSQTKENMNTQVKSFGSSCKLSDKFLNAVQKCGIIESVMSWVRFKQQDQLDKKCSGRKASQLKGVPKLEDANEAGRAKSRQCTLILTEGDSAKSLAVAGLGVVGRDLYGVFPLKGKCLNVREATHKQIMENAEINNLIKILGLQYKRKYETDQDMATLRYGKVMVMADQDQDGSHIKGLVINFIAYNWPSLMKRNFVEEFITPIVKATKGKDEISFFSLPEYQGWKQDTPNWHTWRIKYYKGLGTSTAKEAKEYFSDMARHRIKFRYMGQDDDDAIELAFSKKKIEERKNWLTDWMQARTERRLAKLPEEYLYGSATESISYKDFVNKELILFSNMDNERSIPSLVDGLKPGQRKVLFTCFKRNDKREIKVAQLAGSVAEQSAYHHGEASLMGTIVNLAQNFVGSNNVNVLLPIGQFGTRLQGGKDSASPRYIFTLLNPVTRAIFPQSDDAVLKYLHEDNQRIEPEFYAPIIPMVLVNGAEGIGTGWSTKVVNYNPRDIVRNIRNLINGDNLEPMMPWFKNFKGSIERLEANRYVCCGEIGEIQGRNMLEITELPVRTWTQTYKESVLEPMLSSEKGPALINGFKEYHTDATVKFVVEVSDAQLDRFYREGVHKAFKLATTFSTASMVLFDAHGCLRRFDSVDEIMREFYDVRRNTYIARRNYLLGLLQAEKDRLNEQARFIQEKIDGKIVMENKKKAYIVQKLIDRDFKPDPLKKWKELQKAKDISQGEEVTTDEMEEAERGDQPNTDDEDNSTEGAVGNVKLSDYDYLVQMQLIKLSMEEKEKLMREAEAKVHEYNQLTETTWADMWKNDLDNFMVELEKYEEKERQEELQALAAGGSAARGGKKGKTGIEKLMGQKKAKALKQEVLPSPKAARIEARYDYLREKAAAAAQAAQKKKDGVVGRSKKSTTSTSKTSDSKPNSDDELENSGLMERLLKRSPELKKKIFNADKPDKPKTGGSQPIAKFLSNGKAEKAPKAKKPAKKKKDAWHSDESDEESDGDFQSEASFSDDDEPVYKPRPTARAAGRTNRVQIDDDDDESDSGGVAASTSDKMDDDKHSNAPVSEAGSTVPTADSNTASVSISPPPQAEMDVFDPLNENSDIDEFMPTVSKPKKEPAAKKPKESKKDKPTTSKPKAAAAKPKRKAMAAESDSDDFIANDDSDFEDKPKKKKKEVKKPAAKKSKKAIDSDEEEALAEIIAATPPGPRTARRAAAAVKYNFDDDDDEDSYNPAGEESDGDFQATFGGEDSD